jgi:hypothetical protein
MQLGRFNSPTYLPVSGSQTSIDVVLGLQTSDTFWCFMYHTIAAQRRNQDRSNEPLRLSEDLEKARFIAFFRCSEGLEKGNAEALN